MNMLRNAFLGTSSFLFAPPEKPTTLAEPGDTDGNDAGGETEGTQEEAGGEQEAGGETEGAEDDAGTDDEDDLADLPPEVKARVQKRLEKEVGWRDRQIDRLYRKGREAREDVAAAETIVGGRTTPGQQQNLTAEQVQVEARKIAAADKYDNDANATDAEGRKVYGDKWGPTLAKLPKLGGVSIPDMQDILATDKPHVVLFHLSNPETYEQVMALPPAKRRTQFVKLAMKAEPAKAQEAKAGDKKPSDAAAPVRQLQTQRRATTMAVNLYDDKVSDEDWYAARNATRRKKFSDAS